MRFAIRDDDTCYFTRPEELEAVWGTILPYAPVSLAVTPFALESFHLGDVERFHQTGPPRPLGENAELVCWLRSRLEGASISVMCHGYSHEYQRLTRTFLRPEYLWKSAARVRQETPLARRHLEETLAVPVTTFVPPGNGITRDAIEAVAESFPLLLAPLSIRRLADFRLERAYLAGCARRVYYRFRHRIAPPFVMKLGGLRMMTSFPLTQLARWDELSWQFEICRQLGADFIVAVHYWEIDARLRGILARLLELAARSNCQFSHCQDLFIPAPEGGPRIPHTGAGGIRANNGNEERMLCGDSKTS